MRLKLTLILLFPAVLLTACYMPITGRVIDAETSQPIEGAVVLVEWTKTHGFGEYYHTLYKIEEAETNMDGTFSLAGVNSPFVDKPMLVIYKRGYIAWRNDLLFPRFNKRTDCKIWENNYEYGLMKFEEYLSRDQHHLFMRHGIMGAVNNKTPKYSDATSYELRESLKKQHQ